MKANKVVGFIKKVLKYCLYAIAMFLAMNDKVGFCMQDKVQKPKL